MYHESDPIIKYYDFSLALCPPVEIEYYTNLAKLQNGPCLDLCCGTGILSIETAKKGIKVYSVDNSKSMLNKFEEKLKNEPLNIQSAIKLIESPMSRFTLPERVKLVICRDAFFHNITPEEERKTLQCIHRYLENNGIFAFNIHNPNPNFLVWAQSDESSKFKDRQTYDIPNSKNKLTIQQSLGIDLDKQVVTTKLKFLTKAEDGFILNEEISEWKSRYIFSYEMFYLLEICGFSIKNVYGNYKKEPYNSNTILVIEAIKNG